MGDTYHYTVTSATGGSSVTGSGTVQSATQQVTGIDVSSLPDGLLIYTVALTSPVGNVGSPVQATATLDQTPPANYSIVLDETAINASQATSTGFTLTEDELGTTYTYTVTSDGGDGSVTGSGTVSTADQHVTGIDVSSLPDGTLTYSVTLTDAAGNVGSPVTATATLDTVAPTGYSITADQSLVTASNASAASFTFAGAELGDTYNYTVTSDGGSGSVTGTGTISAADQQVTGIDLSSLSDGNLAYSVTLTNALGNTGDAAVDNTPTLDIKGPTGYSIATDESLIGASDATATSFTFTGAEVGTAYSYTVTSSGGGGSVTDTGFVVAADQQVTGIDVSSLPDGTLTYSVTLTDANGVAARPASATATLDTTAPAGYSITVDQNPVIASDESASSFTFAGAEVGTSYSYTVTSSGGSGSVTGSGTVQSATQQVTGVNVSSLPDGTLSYSVTLTDPAGNVGSPVTAATTLNTAAPTGYSITADTSLINAAKASTTSFPSRHHGGRHLSLHRDQRTGSGSVTGSGTVQSATQQITGVNVSSLADGELVYTVTLTSPVGNVGSPVQVAATLDQTPPANYSIVLDETTITADEATATGFTLTADELGTTYNYTVTSDGGSGSVTGSGTVNSADQHVTGIDVSSLPDGTLTYSVTLTDAAGNVGNPVTATATLAQSLVSVDAAMVQTNNWLA